MKHPHLLQTPRSRREALALIAAAVGAAGTARAATPPAIHRGGTLTAVIELDTKNLDPLRGNAPATDRKIYNLYAESLLLQDVDASIKPWLAASWEIEEGGRGVVFHLRHDVLFQDGTPFNAEAAKFNLDRLLDKSDPVPARQFVQEMRSIDVVDEYTIRVHMAEPAGAFLAIMAAEAGTMMSPTALKARGADFARAPVGTGPFVITSRSSNQIVGERNPHYWRMGADGKPMPYLDKVELNINPNEAIRLIQMRSGAAQLCDPITPKNFDQVTHDANLELLKATLGPVFLLSFNVTKPPFDNIMLRKAFSMAIDRSTLVKAITAGHGTVLHGTMPPPDWAYDAKLPPQSFDLTQAKALYAQSGHKGPITLEVVQRDPDTQMAQVIQAMLKNAGIDLHLEVLERLSNLNKVLHGNYEVTMGRASILQMPDPDVIFTSTYSRVASLNYMGFKDEKIFALVDQAHGELDRDKRRALYTEIQQMLSDQYLQAFLIWSPTQEVASRHLHGLRRDSTMTWHYDEIWLQA
jgi:peptide/nickel transport system substrate-binding protein